MTLFHALLIVAVVTVIVLSAVLAYLMFRHNAATLRITDVTPPGGAETWRIQTPAGAVIAERVLHPDKGEVYRLRGYFRHNANPPEEFVPPARALVVRRALAMAERHQEIARGR